MIEWMLSLALGSKNHSCLEPNTTDKYVETILVLSHGIRLPQLSKICYLDTGFEEPQLETHVNKERRCLIDTEKIA